MSHFLYCRDAGFDCNLMVQGETPEELLGTVRLHALATHGVEVTPAMEGSLRVLIKTG